MNTQAQKLPAFFLFALLYFAALFLNKYLFADWVHEGGVSLLDLPAGVKLMAIMVGDWPALLGLTRLGKRVASSTGRLTLILGHHCAHSQAVLAGLQPTQGHQGSQRCVKGGRRHQLLAHHSQTIHRLRQRKRVQCGL